MTGDECMFAVLHNVSDVIFSVIWKPAEAQLNPFANQVQCQ